MILFCGDIHGLFRDLVNRIERYDISNASIIICGDFGVGFHKKNYYITEFEFISRKLTKRNNKIYAVRGNHDDPSYFQTVTEYNNIILLPDYHVLEIEDKRILMLGGAVSIDRKGRTIGKDYWLDEKFILKEDLLFNIKADIIVSHSAPSFCFPLTHRGLMERVGNDTILYNDVVTERNDITRAYDIISKNNIITNWFYGHYHKNNKENINGTSFECLDELSLSYIN